MMGLVQKNLQAGYISAFLIIFVTMSAAIAGFVIRTPDAHTIAAFAVGGAYATNILTHFNRKDDANWQRLETTMPIKLASVELSRYLAHIVVFGLMCISTAIYTLTNYLAGALDYPFATFVNSIALTASFYLFMAAVQFPLLRVVSAKNAVTVTYCSFIGTLALFFGVMFIAARLPQNLQDIGHWPLAAGSALLFVLSYFISVRLYRRRCLV